MRARGFRWLSPPTTAVIRSTATATTTWWNLSGSHPYPAPGPPVRRLAARGDGDAGRDHGVGRRVIGVGKSADLVVFRARGYDELLSRPQSDRVIFRAGLLLDARVPDYRELDGLFE